MQKFYLFHYTISVQYLVQGHFNIHQKPAIEPPPFQIVDDQS